MHIELVRGSDADLLLADARFRDEWTRIHQRCPWSTSFQGVGFACTWYRIYRGRFEPVLLLSRDPEGVLAGLLPLASSDDGTLMVAGGAQAEYQVWICSLETSDAFVSGAVKALRREFPSSVLAFRYLPPGTPTAWFSGREAGWRFALAAHRRPLLRLGDGGEATRSLAKKSNKSRLNRLERIGPLEFRHVTEPEEFALVCDDIIRNYDFRQAAVHGVAPFRDDDLKKPFHVAMMDTPGLLHVTVLKVGDRCAAAHIGVCGEKEVQLGIIAHDPSLAKHSPGKFHVLFLAQMLRAEGYTQLDLTPGGDSYKERFANGFDEVHELTVYLSLRQHLRDAIRAGIANAIKAPLRAVGIAPERIRVLQRKLSGHHLLSTLLAWVGYARGWVTRRHEMRIYSHNGTDVLGADELFSIRCNALEDLLGFVPGDDDPSPQEFLFTALQRIEDGSRIYTYAERGELMCYGWLTHEGESAAVGEVGQRTGLPKQSAYILDLRVWSRARKSELLAACLRAMLRDAASMAGPVKTHISVPADDALLREVVQQTGFVYEGSQFAQVRFGRARQWTRKPDPKVGRRSD